MDEKEFLNLVIEMIRRGQNPKRNEIVEVLKRSALVFEKTNDYTRRKWNHYKEYIYITTAPIDMMLLIDNKPYIQSVIEQIYPVNDEYEWELFGVEIKPGMVTNIEETTQEIHFDQIEEEIVEELKAAKYTIWIAMAWFTNKRLYDILVAKKDEGINVQLVLDDNPKNRAVAEWFEGVFEVHWVKMQSLYTNTMHDKFCIIDLQKVIHGTFNWTNAANYNRETISVDDNSATARAFADEFKKLKLGHYGLVR